MSKLKSSIGKLLATALSTLLVLNMVATSGHLKTFANAYWGDIVLCVGTTYNRENSLTDSLLELDQETTITPVSSSIVPSDDYSTFLTEDGHLQFKIENQQTESGKYKVMLYIDGTPLESDIRPDNYYFLFG